MQRAITAVFLTIAFFGLLGLIFTGSSRVDCRKYGEAINTKTLYMGVEGCFVEYNGAMIPRDQFIYIKTKQ